jgi:hypothetical protein
MHEFVVVTLLTISIGIVRTRHHGSATMQFDQYGYEHRDKRLCDA